MRTVGDECLDHFVLFSERHLRLVVTEFMKHYLAERFHQGIGGYLIRPNAVSANDNGASSAVACHSPPRRTSQLLPSGRGMTAPRWVSGYYGSGRWQ